MLDLSWDVPSQPSCPDVGQSQQSGFCEGCDWQETSKLGFRLCVRDGRECSGGDPELQPAKSRPGAGLPPLRSAGSLAEWQ